MFTKIILVSFLLAAAGTGAAADPAPTPPQAVADDAELPQQVPPGTPEDQKLWKAGGEVAPRIGLARRRANQLQWEARQKGILERLEAFAKKEGPGGKAAALLERYRTSISFNHTTMMRQWPVDPTRGCGYALLGFESMLYAGDHPRRATQLLVAREELQDCVSRAEPAIQVMLASNKDLEAVTAEVEALIGPPPAALPAQARPK